MTVPKIIQVTWKDEGDFGFISTLTDRDLAYKVANPESIGIPFNPDRVRAYGSIADAQALADEHGAELVLA
jgi:hypothetical protein